MKYNKLQKGIDELKSIKMTSSEKELVLSSILKSSPKIVKPIKSTWVSFSFMALLERNRLVYYIIIPLIIVLSGGGVVFASADSLPNGILYPVKVKILEPVEGALIFSQTAKAKHESNLAKRRLIEAETLAEAGKLDISTEDKINILLENHTNALNKALDKAVVEDINSKNETEDISTNFRAEMNAHARILDIITKKEEHKNENGSQNENQNQNIDINTNIQIKQDKKEEVAKDGELSNTARSSAEKVKDNDKQQEVKSGEVYVQKKDKIENLINTTDKKLEVHITEDKKFNNRKVIVNTSKTFNKAKSELEEADKKNREGDSKEAYKALLDSESSIKEVNILLESHYENEEKHEEENHNDD